MTAGIWGIVGTGFTALLGVLLYLFGKRSERNARKAREAQDYVETFDETTGPVAADDGDAAAARDRLLRRGRR